MSNTDHIGNPAESVSRPRSVTPRHPLLTGPALEPSGVRDTLNNCAATLHMLSDLFGDTDQERYPVLESRKERYGMFLQLQGVACTLEAIEELLGIEAEQAYAEREAERLARQDRSRSEEQRIAEDAATIEKRVILASAFADVFRKVMDAKPATAE